MLYNIYTSTIRLFLFLITGQNLLWLIYNSFSKWVRGTRIFSGASVHLSGACI
jgi:hypothetical protein